MSRDFHLTAEMVALAASQRATGNMTGTGLGSQLNRWARFCCRFAADAAMSNR